MHKRKRYQCVKLQKITKSQRKTVRGINERKKKGNNSQDGNNKYLHVNTLFPTVKFHPSFAAGELAHYSPWLQTLNCNFLLIPNKLIFAREITGSLFISG